MIKTIINELNTLLKGEKMAVRGYEKYIENIDDYLIKNKLQEIQIDHKHHAIKLAQRVQNLGGRPADGIGVAGELGEIMSTFKSIRKHEPNEILKAAYNGENNGIRMAAEIVKGDLDSQSASIVNEILNMDRGHLSTLNNLINDK